VLTAIGPEDSPSPSTRRKGRRITIHAMCHASERVICVGNVQQSDSMAAREERTPDAVWIFWF